MTRLRIFASALSLATLLLGQSVQAESAQLPVTATFTEYWATWYSRWGDSVHVTTPLVGPDGDAHVYQPSPQDVRTLGQSHLLVSNGLGFEGWLDRLAQSSGFKGTTVVASHGITLDVRGEHEDGHDPPRRLGSPCSE